MTIRRKFRSLKNCRGCQKRQEWIDRQKQLIERKAREMFRSNPNKPIV